MALRVSGVNLVVNGADEFESRLTEANRAARRTTAEMKRLDATYGKGAQNVDYLTQRQALLTRQLEIQQKKTQVLRDAREAYAQTENVDPGKLEKLDLSIISAETAEANLERQLRETSTALEQQGQAAQEAEQAQKSHAQAAEHASTRQQRLAASSRETTV